MHFRHAFLFLSFAVPISLWYSPPAVAQSARRQSEEAPVVIERGAHHKVWQTQKQVIGANGQVTIQTGSYVELATGLHYWENNQWKETKEEIEITGNGASFIKGPHKVHFAPNLNSAGAIDLTTVDGHRLRSHILGLSYFDASTGQSTLIAEIKHCQAEVLPPNQVIYRDAFTDFKADVRYTYRRGSFEQDVILREKPPGPEEFGLNPATTRLEVLTEFLNPPQPKARANVLKQLFFTPQTTNSITSKRYPGVFVDEQLSFGSMSMGRGLAFPVPSIYGALDPTDQKLPVGKVWDKLNGRDFLIEAVEYPVIKAILDTLPKPQVMIIPKDQRRKVVKERELPTMKVVSLDTAKPIRMASVLPVEKGLVIDYNLSGSISNFVLRSDTTYFVSGAVSFSGTNWVEGGTVVKYANTNSAKLSFDGTVNWPSAQYRPAIFTAADDRTLGEDISGWTNSPVGNLYADVAIESTSISKIQNVRVLYASKALRFSGSSTFELRHAQILNCDTAIDGSGGGRVDTRNILIYNVNNGYKLDNFKAGVEHLTFYGATNFYTTNNITNTCVFATNSILVGVSNIITTYLSTNQTWVYSSGQAGSVFESVGAGGHYLAAGSTNRNTGTTTVNYSLRQDLTKRTTYPPLVYTGNLPASMLVVEQAYRDTDTPDLGYHYDAIDYALGNASVTNSISLFVKPGTILGVFNTNSETAKPGLNFNGGSSVLVSVGHPHNMNRFVVFNTVQEQPSSTWYPNLSAVVAATNSSATLSAQFRFTEWSMLGTNSPHYTGGKTNESVSIMDNQFRGGMVQSSGSSLNITNSLFERSVLNLGSNAASANFHNNTFFGGAVTLSTNLTGTWTFLNNFFDQATITQTGTVSQQTNAYAYHFGSTNYSRLTPTNATTDVLMATNMIYLQGELGSFYIPTNCMLTNAGGRSATNAGLYHHTIHTSQVKETNSVVDIGFHYVAVSDYEIPKSTMTASGSSTYPGPEGWAASKTIDGLTTDVGWHNEWANESPAYLRIDLGISKTVDNIGYIPRQGAVEVGTSGNGSYKDYEIYVTDSASTDPNDWGSAAAAGTWSWETGQHREDVSFSPIFGRYVIFRRITATGYHGESGTEPGYASANEVWIYGAGNGVPLDTDGDGLPDYFEDKNGSGGTGTGETSFAATDTDSNSISDPIEDTDYDGLNNLLEYLNGMDPNSASQSIAQRLAYFPFDSTNFVGSAGQLPFRGSYITNITSWKTNALHIPIATEQAEFTQLLNVDFGGEAVSPKSGFAATGLTTEDFWNDPNYGTSMSNLKWSDHSDSDIGMTLLDSAGAWANGHTDPMMNSFYYSSATMYMVITNLPAGTYEIYLYGHGNQGDEENSMFTVDAHEVNYGSAATATNSDWASTTWTEGWQYVRFTNIAVSANGGITVTITPDGVPSQASICGFQLVRNYTGSPPARLAYRDVESNGNANVNLANGTVSFWFKPDWTGINSSGSGPGTEATLLRVGDDTNWWSLHVNSDGSQLFFAAATNGTSTNYVAFTLTNWVSNVWHQVVVAYTPSNSVLYLDGQSAAVGDGVDRYPNATTRAATKLNVGSDRYSDLHAYGQFEELETYNYPLSASDILANYQADHFVMDGDSDGDGVPDYIETLLGRNPLIPGAVADTNGVLNVRIFTPLK